jgi:hypothetical protein
MRPGSSSVVALPMVLRIYVLQDHDVLYSSGSYGELGYSDMQTGVSSVFLQAWAVNAELNKLFETRDRALAIIYHLRAKKIRTSSRS